MDERGEEGWGAWPAGQQSPGKVSQRLGGTGRRSAEGATPESRCYAAPILVEEAGAAAWTQDAGRRWAWEREAGLTAERQ